jgi:hypothetical protein
MAMTNKNFTQGGEAISAQIPIYLGSLARGNMMANGTTVQPDPGVWVINPGAGGHNQSLNWCSSGNPQVPDGCTQAGGVSYPDNDAFSPVLVLADNEVTTGFNFLGVDPLASIATMSLTVNKRLTEFGHGMEIPGGERAVISTFHLTASLHVAT